MIIKTYPVGHFNGDDTVADWPNGKNGRIIWTEEKLSLEDLAQLAEEGYSTYVTNQPLLEDDGPGFAHSMFKKGRGPYDVFSD